MMVQDLLVYGAILLSMSMLYTLLIRVWRRKVHVLAVMDGLLFGGMAVAAVL